MCGILGIIRPGASRAALQQAGQLARACLEHRGPDQEGTDQEDGWYLSHHRLAIFDVSSAGRQPMSRVSLRVVFNGAIYNFPELKEELTRLGHQFKTETDTEVILAAYQEWGTDCFTRFNGMWALGIIDTERNELVLSRDRYGIKPLYTYQDHQQLVFASEPKAIHSLVPVTQAINRAIAFDFLINGWQDHRPETLWEHIHQFPAASYAVYSLSEQRITEEKNFYQFPILDQHKSVPKQWKEQLRDLFQASVQLRTRSNVGYGLTLSGGMDSSSIAGAIAKHGGQKPTTYSALFPDTPFDESPFVNAVTDFTGFENRPFYPDYAQFITDADACVVKQGQPLASAAVVSHFGLMRTLQLNGEKVLLNGQGGDEIGAGYDKFLLVVLRNEWQQLPMTSLLILRNLVFGQGLSLRKVLNRLRSRQLNAVPQAIWGSTPSQVNVKGFFRRPDQDVYNTSINLLQQVGLPSLLRHEDRNTMAFGLESRTPFLDYRLVDFTLRLPSSVKLARGVRKNALQQAFSNYLPTLVKERRNKLGFATPQEKWMVDHQAFFLNTIQAYVSQSNDYLSPTALSWSKTVLAKRQYHHFAQIWRLWAWAHFCINNTD
ncbi:MAG: asparagine synthase (glutamine-hydrolyzing) [Bacteroidota bacterium]